MNAIELLSNDHKTVRALLTELERTTNRSSQRRTQLLATIAREIKIHTSIEEELFYPAVKRAGKTSDDAKMYFEALEEHRAAGDMVLPDLQKTDTASDKFGGRAKVLKELIEHHAKEEETKMFPRARKLLGTARLQQLGAAMAERKRELEATAAQTVMTTAEKIIGAVATLIMPDQSGTDAKGRKPASSARSRAPTAKKKVSTTGNATKRSAGKATATNKTAGRKTAAKGTTRQLANGHSRITQRQGSARP